MAKKDVSFKQMQNLGKKLILWGCVSMSYHILHIVWLMDFFETQRLIFTIIIYVYANIQTSANSIVQYQNRFNIDVGHIYKHWVVENKWGTKSQKLQVLETAHMAHNLWTSANVSLKGSQMKVEMLVLTRAHSHHYPGNQGQAKFKCKCKWQCNILQEPVPITVQCEVPGSQGQAKDQEDQEEAEERAGAGSHQQAWGGEEV